MDILQGAFESDTGETRYLVGAAAFSVPGSVAALAGDRAVDLGIRPEHIQIGVQGTPTTVRVVQPLGPMTYLTVSWEGGSLTARLPGMSSHEAGQPALVSLSSEHLMLFDRESGRRIEGSGDHG
jgi:ABC-type sugar transport system ATPase subunit